MRNLAIFLGLASAMSLTSCAAGPHQLQRTVDDWDQKMYVESPWIDAVLWVVPVFPVLHFGASIADFFVTDGYTFWVKDAWDGKGTAYEHYKVEPTDGTYKSLLIDDAGYLRSH